MSQEDFVEWYEEGREPTLQEAWEMLSGYIEHDLGPLAGQDGTAEIWQSLEVVGEAIKPALQREQVHQWAVVSSPLDLRNFDPISLEEAVGLAALAGKKVKVIKFVSDTVTVEGGFDHLFTIGQDVELLIG